MEKPTLTQPSFQRIDHYCQLECGVAKSYHALVASCADSQRHQQHDVPLAMDLHHLPSRLDIENRLQQISVNRAPGIDGLKPQFLRDQDSSLSEQLTHLAMRMWLLGHEPVQFKGGTIHSISKKVHSLQVANVRGIL